MMTALKSRDSQLSTAQRQLQGLQETDANDKQSLADIIASLRGQTQCCGHCLQQWLPCHPKGILHAHFDSAVFSVPSEVEMLLTGSQCLIMSACASSALAFLGFSIMCTRQ